MATVHAFTGFEAGEIKDAAGVFYECMVTLEGVAEISETARTGTYGLHVHPAGDSGNDFAQLGVPGGDGTITGNTGNADCYCSFMVYFDALPADEEMFFEFHNTGTDGHHLRIDENGCISMYDSGDSLLSAGSTELETETWYEIQVSQLNSTSAYELILDGVQEFSGSNSSPADYWNKVYLGRHGAKNDEEYAVIFDDVVFSSGGFVDTPFYVEALLPNAAGNYSDWTSGDYTDINEIPMDIAGDDDFITAGGTNTHSCQCANTTLTGAVAAVKSSGMVKRNNAGDSVKIFTRSGSSEDKVATAKVTINPYLALEIVSNTDPATSSAWLLGAVNTAEIGMEATLSGGTGPLWGSGQIHILAAGTAATVARRLIAYNFGG